MSYSNISDVGQALVKILKEELVPDMVMKSESIVLGNPADNGDISVYIHLYDIQENYDVRLRGMQNTGINRQSFPKSYLNLYYMITVYSDSEVKFKAIEEARILGKIYQTLRDIPVIPMSRLTDMKDMPDMGIHIDYINMDMTEKIKVWPSNSKPYKTSLFYKVYPIGIESLRQKDISRVMDIDFTISEQ